MTMPHLMNCGHSEKGWCLTCVHELNARLETFEEETARWKAEIVRLLAEGRHAKACFDAAQEQAVRLACEVDRLRDALEEAHAEADTLKRLRDELIEMNEHLKHDIRNTAHRAETAEENHRMEKQRLESCKTARELIRQQNEEWHRRVEQLNRDIDELRERAEKAEQFADSHHAMMNGPRIAQALGLSKKDEAACVEMLNREPESNFPISKCQCLDSTGWTAIRCCNLCGLMHKSETLDWRTGPLERGKMPSDTPRTDAATIACGWDTTQPVVPKPLAQDMEREISYREQQRREIQKEWERSHDAWRNAIVRCEALLVALKETNYLLANEPQAWAQTKTDQMRRNQEIIDGK